jgi:hypothetical protein
VAADLRQQRQRRADHAGCDRVVDEALHGNYTSAAYTSVYRNALDRHQHSHASLGQELDGTDIKARLDWVGSDGTNGDNASTTCQLCSGRHCGCSTSAMTVVLSFAETL